MSASEPCDSAVLLVGALGELLQLLRTKGYQLVGPTVRNGAIVHAEILGIEDLPAGWTEVREGGTYRLNRTADGALLGYSVGPRSWKQLSFVPRLRLWKAPRIC